MPLVFDAVWFDARLVERGLDRAALAAAAGLSAETLQSIYARETPLSAEAAAAMAALLKVDPVEVMLRGGTVAREPADVDSEARILSIEARLDAVDAWIEQFERERKLA